MEKGAPSSTSYCHAGGKTFHAKALNITSWLRCVLVAVITYCWGFASLSLSDILNFSLFCFKHKCHAARNYGYSFKLNNPRYFLVILLLDTKLLNLLWVNFINFICYLVYTYFFLNNIFFFNQIRNFLVKKNLIFVGDNS